MRLPISGAYPADWPQLAERVKAEAGYRCVRCGHPYRKGDDPRAGCDERCTHPRDGKQRVLTVHHLTGAKDERAWWALLSLCQVCHLSVQSRVIPARGYLLSHSPWFRPFVCGYYARYYGGLDITREQADAEPARWLALGQPWLFEGAAS